MSQTSERLRRRGCSGVIEPTVRLRCPKSAVATVVATDFDRGTLTASLIPPLAEYRQFVLRVGTSHHSYPEVVAHTQFPEQAKQKRHPVLGAFLR